MSLVLAASKQVVFLIIASFKKNPSTDERRKVA